MTPRLNKTVLIGSVTLLLLWGGSLSVNAQTSANPNTVSEEEAGIFAGLSEACWELGDCNLCDILLVVINIANGILQIFAVLATVFFIWGAGYLMLSSGNEQRVTKGKDIIKATVIGSLIVLFAWQGMNYVVIVLANESIFEQQETLVHVQLSPLGWYTVADQCEMEQGTGAVAPYEQTGPPSIEPPPMPQSDVPEPDLPDV